MTALSIFKSPKKELAAEREKLDKRWQELAEKESALKAEKTAADIKQRKADEYGRIHNIPIERIVPNPSQPRRQFEDESIIRLADSIRQYGILQPLTVRRMEEDELLPLGEQRMEVVAGERRLRAAKLLSLRTVPCIIVDVDSRKSAELAIIENIQREDLNSVEIALAYQHLLEQYGLTQERLSERVGKKRTTIANYLRLLKLPAPIQMAIQNKQIDMGHARALVTLADPKLQVKIFEEIIEHGYSVRKVEELVKSLSEGETVKSGGRKIAPKRAKLPEEFNMLKQQLSGFFSTKVQLTCSEKGKGKISIPFNNEEDLERIIGILDTLKK